MTLSLSARCPRTGRPGIAVGARVAFAAAGVGAVHDQPVTPLRDLCETHRPRVDEFVARALEPDTVGVTVEPR
jgi:hypothetical protein